MEMKKTVYVENAERFIYKIADVEQRADGWLNIGLELVCGYDYINADESDAQGYVGKENFVEEIDTEVITCDMMNESITEALEYHGFKIIEKLPPMIDILLKAVDRYNELQEDESARLDWWNDVVDNIQDINDEKEIETAIAEINAKIEMIATAGE